MENKEISQQQIQENKTRFCELLIKTNRPGMDKLIAWLEKTDFFEAPASTKYHEPYAGGLCEHSLAVYDEFCKLNKIYSTANEQAEIVCSLLHDICKTNYYSASTRNVKNEETGQWEKVPYYTVNDAFPMGHGEKSVFLVERFIRLKPDEAIAIRWHMGGFDESVRGGSYSLSNAYVMYPMAAMLNLADMAATYLLPKNTEAKKEDK